MSNLAKIVLLSVVIVLAAAVVALTAILVLDTQQHQAELKALKQSLAAANNAIATGEEERASDMEALRAELERLNDRWKDVDYLKKKVAELGFQVTGKAQYEPDAFKYFAIGNSITWHCKCDYWWNEIGMAASKPENDYVHRVVAGLEELHGKVSYYALNFATWETQAADRAQTLSTLNPYLHKDLDLITVQLSENASNLTDFVSDYKELIAFLKEKCPNAEILIIDDFWNAYKSDLKKAVAQSCDVTFVSLAEIRGKQEYKSAIDAIVYDDKGEPHKVWHSGVADHPGDEGMKYIAEAVLGSLADRG